MMDPKELNEQTVQAGQPGYQTETASLSQSDIEQQPMTTEEFHRQLEENVTRHADERIRHQTELCDIKDRYTEELNAIAKEEQDKLDRFRDARDQFEGIKASYEMKIRQLAARRNEAGRKFHIAQAEEANRWTLTNNNIQCDRHNIFERYRNSGGQFMDDASELLHPGWSRKDKKNEKSVKQ